MRLLQTDSAPFQPKIGKSYYCDNYTLSHSPLIGRWEIWLKGAPIINDKHTAFFSMVDCFKWKLFKEDEQPKQWESTFFDDFNDLDQSNFTDLQVCEVWQEYGIYQETPATDDYVRDYDLEPEYFNRLYK